MVASKLASRTEGKRVGRYELVCEVARGFFGALWIARDPAEEADPGLLLSRRVRIPPSKQRSLIQVAEWASQLVDDHLVGGADVVVDGNQVDLLVPYIEGEPLRALIRAAAFQREPLSHAVGLRVALDVLSQLEALHATANAEVGAQFGGVQPDSLVVGADGKTRLIDVGTSVVASSIDPWRRDPQRSAYLAPEQLHSATALDARCDVFVVGALLWEMLANRRLFAGATDGAIRDRIKKAAAPQLDQLKSATVSAASADLAEVVGRALQRNRDRRFSSAATFAAALRHVADVAEHSDVAAVVQRLAKAPLGKRRAALEKIGVDAGSRDALVIRDVAAAPPEPIREDVEEAEEIEPDAELGLPKRSPPLKDRTPPPPPSRRSHTPRLPSLAPSPPGQTARTAAPLSVMPPSAPPRPPSLVPTAPQPEPAQADSAQALTPQPPAVEAVAAPTNAATRSPSPPSARPPDRVPDSQRPTSVPDRSSADALLSALEASKVERTPDEAIAPALDGDGVPPSTSSIPPRPSSTDVDESELFDGNGDSQQPPGPSAEVQEAVAPSRPDGSGSPQQADGAGPTELTPTAPAPDVVPAPPQAGQGETSASPVSPVVYPESESPSLAPPPVAVAPQSESPSLAPPPVAVTPQPPDVSKLAEREPRAVPAWSAKKWVWAGAAAAVLAMIGIAVATSGAEEETATDQSPSSESVAAAVPAPDPSPVEGASDTEGAIASASASAAPSVELPVEETDDSPQEDAKEAQGEADRAPAAKSPPPQRRVAPAAAPRSEPPARRHRPPPPQPGHTKPNAGFKPGGI